MRRLITQYFSRSAVREGTDRSTDTQRADIVTSSNLDRHIINVLIAFTMKLVFASWMTAVSIGPSFARAFTRRSSLFGKSSRPLAAMAAMISPPNARREEDRVVWAGTLPDNSDNNSKLARQSETSMEPLLDPPISIPDPYGWMRDEKRSNEEVLNHLKAENTYTESLTSHLAELRETLYKEMLSSIQETDFTTPRPKGDFTYYSRTYEGKSYSVSCRAPKPPQGDDLSEMLSAWDGSADTPVLPGEEIVLDTNAIAEDQSYCSTGTIKMSPSQKVLAYSVDFTGDETYYPVIQSLETKEMILNDTSLEIDAPLVWGNDDQTIFYTKMDEAHRPYQVFRKNLETGVEELLYEEHDELFWMGIEKTLDGKYLFVEMSSMETSEYYFLDLTNPSAELQCIAQRRPKVLYNVDHRDGYWWIASNVGGTPNMKLLVAPAVANCESEWKLVNDADGNILFDGGYERSLDDVESFQTHVVCSGRQGGMPRIWIVSFQQDDVASSVKKMEMLQFEEEAHDVGLNINREYDTETIAVSYDSLITPPSTIDISLQDPSDRKILKEKAVPGYDRSLYGCDRLDVPSRDGTTQIPISIVYRKDIMEEHQKTEKPVTAHLYGYGSYGSCCEADFDATRLPLLGRG